MHYALLLLNGTDQSSQESAFNFAQAALKAGHAINRIFFYGDAVYLASALQQPPQGQIAPHLRWHTLSKAHGIDLVVCIAAALKRGICDTQEAERYQLAGANLADGFALSGLGQLIESSVTCDRLITFG